MSNDLVGELLTTVRAGKNELVRQNALDLLYKLAADGSRSARGAIAAIERSRKSEFTRRAPAPKRVKGQKSMPTPKTAAEKLQEAINSDPFLSGDDVHLDLSSMPHLIPLADAPEEEDNFAMPDRTSKGLGSADLKKFLASPDRESVAELHDPELLKRYDEQHGDGTTVFAREIPFQVYQRNGKWRAKGTVDGQLHRFTADSRDELFPKITAAVQENTVQELSPSERLQVVRIAQSGDTQGAIVRYLEFAIGDERARRYANQTEMLGDPELAEVFDDAAILTWFASRSNVQDSGQWNAFLDEYAGGRPYTHALLDGAWSQFEKQQHTSALFAPAREAEKPPTARQIDDLDDASVNRLMLDTKKQFVREVKAGTR